MTLAMVTLTITRQFYAHGLLPGLGDAFKEEVVVSHEPREIETQVYVAEYDEDGNIPAPPVMGEEFSAEWKPFAEVFGGPEPAQDGDGGEAVTASPPASD